MQESFIGHTYTTKHNIKYLFWKDIFFLKIFSISFNYAVIIVINNKEEKNTYKYLQHIFELFH